ncbi:hypothetical protein BGZ95_001941 [Linnemannia exigua]|uniref:LIM zinc-binding domain-containing protein n=1 Tax=Linnemannia exigua TaxID=604196 RepID=A0AAD4DNG0_9FUNG|nr:hypothetical protein BGZ95_001941 [Linnemannia exigua]
MMSTRPCGNCKKTVYVNEKMDAEGRWYHRPCFKCMAPNCGTSLTMRTFQMAALDDSVIDEMTRRPLKVLVCKEHVPMPKASISSDSLGLKHSTTAPKPAMAGLHRSFMGDRGKDGSNEENDHASTPKTTHSPRSLDQGSHAHILKGLTKENKESPLSISTATTLASTQSHSPLHSSSSSNAHTPKSAKAEVRSMSTTTLPKFRHGRFTLDPSSTSASESIAVAHTAAEDAQDPSKDDDSYRTIPVRHRDYGHTEDATSVHEEEDNKQERVFTLKGSNNHHHRHESSSHDDIDVSLETAEDLSERAERDHLHINSKDVHAVEEAEVKAPHGDKEEHKLVGMAFHSKLMDHHKVSKNDHQHSSKDESPEVDDDEWDTTPADDYNRRETVAGM